MTQQDFSGGQASDINVSLAPPNTVNMGLNVDFDVEIGSAVSRLGTSTIGAQILAGSNVLGLWQHIDTVTSSNNKLFATINASGGATSRVYDVIGAANLTGATGLTANTKMRFLTYGGATLMINGADAERSYTAGGGVITTGGVFDLANIPTSNTAQLTTEFLDRHYVAGDATYPSRLFYSGVYSGTAFSWTSGNGYVDIEAEDAGGGITALAKVPGYILIFKERSLHRWNYSSAFPESLIQIGTPSQESVVMGGGLVAFYSNSNEGAKGFYITNGGRPQCISQDNNRPIKKWVDAIASATEANIAGWATDRYFCWSIGDVTVDTETYSNVVLKYNRILNQWSVRTYPQEFKVFASYLVSGVNTTVGGADDGTVYRMDVPGVYVDANTTTTQNFGWKVRQQHLNYGDNHAKVISERVVVRGKNVGDVKINAYVDEILDPIPLNRGFWKKVLSLFGVSKTIRGTTISIEVAGESRLQSILREIEIPNIVVQNTYE